MPNFLSTIKQGGVAVSLAGHTHTDLVPHGTSWPASPATNSWFARDDLGIMAQWNGARWLGLPEIVPFTLWALGPPFTANNLSAYIVPLDCQFEIIDLYARASVATTNNASNYWTIYKKSDATIATSSTATIAPNTSAILAGAYTPGLFSSVSTKYIRVEITKTGSPGALSLSVAMRIRRVYP